MSFVDPVGDMITRIRNAQLRALYNVKIPNSKFRAKILEVLKQEGYISNYKTSSDKNNNKFGYPFVNKNWKPHLTIASMNKIYISDSLFKNFLKSKKHLQENFKYVYFYKYSNGRHFFLWKSKILND